MKAVRSINPIKSLFYSWKWCGFANAYKFPVLISYGTKIRVGRGAKVIVLPPFSFNKIRIVRSSITLYDESTLEIGGKTFLNYQTSISIYWGACFKLFGRFCTNGNCVFNVAKLVEFGDDTLFSANALVYDTDLHSILNSNGEIINHNAPIKVGDRVWFGNRITLLKGTEIGNDIVFGSSSLISGKYLTNHAIYGGVPARLLKEGIKWSYAFPINQ